MATQEGVASAALINVTEPEEYDLVILGGGTGSTVAAWTFAGQGKRVAVIDRKYIGGSCPNIACLPSKNIIYSAKVASYVRRTKVFGINHNGFTIDMSGVRRAQAQDGAWAQPHVFGKLQEHGSGVHFSDGKVHGSGNGGGRTGRLVTCMARM